MVVDVAALVIALNAAVAAATATTTTSAAAASGAAAAAAAAFAFLAALVRGRGCGMWLLQQCSSSPSSSLLLSMLEGVSCCWRLGFGDKSFENEAIGKVESQGGLIRLSKVRRC